jgi:hypothetical protein
MDEDAGRRFREFRDAVDEEHAGTKVPELATVRLSKKYQGLSDSERTTVDQVLSEWLLSGDEGLEMDAWVLVSQFKILSALPALRTLADRLERSFEQNAPYYWQSVNRIIGELTEQL